MVGTLEVAADDAEGESDLIKMVVHYTQHAKQRIAWQPCLPDESFYVLVTAWPARFPDLTKLGYVSSGIL